MKSKNLNKGVLRLAALAAAVAAGPALADSTLSIDPTPAFITLPATQVTVTVNLAQDGTSNGADAIINYDTTIFNSSANALEGACISDDATGRVVMSAGGFSDTRDICEITFTRDPAAPEGTYPLTFSNVVFATPSGGDQAIDGQIIIQTVNDAALAFTPPSGGTVTFPGGTQGNTVSESIDITVTGSGGSGTVDNCVFSGPDATAFSVTSAQPIVVAAGGSGSIDLECVLDEVAQSAVLTCDTSDGGGAGTASWDMSCPAGTPIPAPEYDSTPAPGGTINCSGTPESTQNRTLTISNTGELDLTVFGCSTADAGFSVTGPAFPQVIAAGGSIDVGIQCTVPADGNPAITGTLTCTSDDANEASVDYGLIAGPVTVPPANPAPAIIPANSLWSLLALFGVIAGIGAVVVGIRRH